MSGKFVNCDGCGRNYVPEADSFHCLQCPDYDLCKQCFVIERGEIHPAHFFIHAFPATVNEATWQSLASDVTITLTDASENWMNIICDGCMRLGLPQRFKCSDCDDFDLCHACFQFSKMTHDPDHRFVLMKASGDTDTAVILRQPLPDAPREPCPGAFCDACGATSMRQVYACTECSDFCICGPCFDRKQHGHHKLAIFYSPSVMAGGSGDSTSRAITKQQIDKQLASAKALLEEGVTLVETLDGQIERIRELIGKREGRMLMWGIGAIVSHGILAPGMITASDKFNGKIDTELQIAERRVEAYIQKLKQGVEGMEEEICAALKDPLENVLEAIKNRIEVIKELQPNWIGCRNWDPIEGLDTISGYLEAISDGSS